MNLLILAPQHKRDSLRIRRMSEFDLDPMWAEFSRLRITPTTFAKLIPGSEAQLGDMSNFEISIGPEILALLKSLPDGAGEEVVPAALRSKFKFRDADA